MNPKRIILALAIATAVFLGACGSDPVSSEPARLWIEPDLVDCQGEALQKCMRVATSEGGEYLNFYDQIDGFVFVEGTSYVIDVTIDEVDDPPADASSLRYTLVEIVEEVAAEDG